MSFKTTALLFGSLLIGAATGFAGGYLFSKNKYQEIADKEIADVKKVYESHFASKEENPKKENNENKKPVAKEPKEDPAAATYINYAGKYAGGNVNDELPPQILKGKTKKSKSNKKPPYVINGTQLGELEDYRIVTLKYYKDKVLADEDENAINNFKEVVGPNALNSFGEADAVYVRDDNLKIDYEILLDERCFSEIHGSDN